MNRRNNNVRGPQNQNQQQSNGNQQQQQQQQEETPQVDQPQNNNDTTDGAEEGIGAKMRKLFANRKNLSSADRKRLEKERKARQLRRMHKLLTPKGAVLALHELQGSERSEFIVNHIGQDMIAEVVVNNVRYEATAPSKNKAKSLAAEKALRDLVIAQMTKARQNAEEQSTNGNENEDVEMSEEAEDLPMLNLASYALYKLFNGWQREGFDIPILNPKKIMKFESGPSSSITKPPKTKDDLPDDAADRHPAALLAFMRPQVPYEDLGENNNDANERFSIGVTVDGQQFIGKARSKKDARKEAAAAACRSLFGVQFVETSSSST